MKNVSWIGLLAAFGCSEGVSDEVTEDTVPDDADGCAAATVAADQITLGKTVDGLERRFRFSAPAVEAGEKLPLVMAFHGGGGAGDLFPQEDEFNELVDSENLIMVYPIAELVSPNEGEWQLNTRAGAMHDIHFLEAILDEMGSRYCVDQDRLYATGYSLGAMYTYEVACHMNDRFAAVASFAGTMPVSPDSCALVDNIALMNIHGDEDQIIPYGSTWDWKEWDSVGTMMAAPSVVDFWSEKNNCQISDESATTDGAHRVHDECDGGVRVEHHRLSGVDHGWPWAINGTSTPRVIWDFLSAFQKQ